MKRQKILIIGGTGFIGSHVVSEAVRRGMDVTSISLNNPSKDRISRDVNYILIDITDSKLTSQTITQDYDYVINLGGYIDHRSFIDGGRVLIEGHFTGVQNLVESIPRKGLKRFIQVGSSDEYGSVQSPQTESVRENPISPYSLAKVCTSHFLQMIAATEEYPSVCLRLFLTYGPGQDFKRFLPQIIKGCMSGKPFPVSEGSQLRDFCYVSDTVRAIFACLETDAVVGEVLNIASGNPVEIRKMIEKVREIVGSGNPVFGQIPYRSGENMKLFADVRKARRLLGWKPMISLADGLKTTVEWYENRL